MIITSSIGKEICETCGGNKHKVCVEVIYLCQEVRCQWMCIRCYSDFLKGIATNAVGQALMEAGRNAAKELFGAAMKDRFGPLFDQREDADGNGELEPATPETVANDS